jgi:hypothetical protein
MVTYVMSDVAMAYEWIVGFRRAWDSSITPLGDRWLAHAQLRLSDQLEHELRSMK